MRRFLFALIALLFGSCTAVAQSDCTIFAKDGLYDYHGKQVDHFHFNMIRNWLESHEFKSLQDAEASAQSFGIGVYIFNFQFGSASAESNFSQWRKDFLAVNYSSAADSLAMTSIAKEVSSNIAGIIQNCLNTQYGVSLWIQSDDDTQFDVLFRFRPPQDSTHAPTVKVRSFNVTNARCTPSGASIKTVGPLAHLHCTKNRATDVSVASMNTSEFGPKPAVFRPFEIPKLSSYRISGSVYRVGQYVGQPINSLLIDRWLTDCGGDPRVPVCTFPFDITLPNHAKAGQITPISAGNWPNCDGSPPIRQMQIDNKLHFEADVACDWSLNQSGRSWVISYYANLTTEIIERTRPVTIDQHLAADDIRIWAIKYDKGSDPQVKKWKTVFDLTVSDENGGVWHILNDEEQQSYKPAGSFRVYDDDNGTLLVGKLPPSNQEMADVTDVKARKISDVISRITPIAVDLNAK